MDLFGIFAWIVVMFLPWPYWQTPAL